MGKRSRDVMSEEREAHAAKMDRMREAAPELYEALLAFVDADDTAAGRRCPCGHCNRARAALAKAEGR